MMSSLLQMKAQFESLTNQYVDNLAEIDACVARRDEGTLFTLFVFFFSNSVSDIFNLS